MVAIGVHMVKVDTFPKEYSITLKNVAEGVEYEDGKYVSFPDAIPLIPSEPEQPVVYSGSIEEYNASDHQELLHHEFYEAGYWHGNEFISDFHAPKPSFRYKGRLPDKQNRRDIGNTRLFKKYVQL